LGPQYLQGKKILELGSGTGLVGLIAATLGGGRVWITDQVLVKFYGQLLRAPLVKYLHNNSSSLRPLLSIMSQNVWRNGLDGSVIVEELNWSAQSCDLATLHLIIEVFLEG
jgi:protein N-lysine methyltransferase METTL21A